MTVDRIWHPEATAEFDADIHWYEDRELGLGDRFETGVLTTVDATVDHPDAWPGWPGWDREPVVRSKRVASFPYRVVYYVEGDPGSAVGGHTGAPKTGVDLLGYGFAAGMVVCPRPSAAAESTFCLLRWGR